MDYVENILQMMFKRPNEDYGTRCEVKNLNSIKFIKQAIEYESKRQIDVIEKGGTIDQNTLLFDTNTGKTKPMRSISRSSACLTSSVFVKPQNLTLVLLIIKKILWY